jgi:hypothetical protein
MTAGAGQDITFDATAGDADPGEKLTYQWAYDDGTSAAGATVQHAFTSAGDHSATLTVSDPVGLTATAQITVTVTAVPVTVGSSTLPGLASQGPSLSGLKLEPTRFRAAGRTTLVNARRTSVGTWITYALSKPATVTFALERSAPGRRVGARCRAATPADRRQAGCVRWLPIGTMAPRSAVGMNRVRFSGRLRGRALDAGRYRMRAQALDSDGRRSATLVATFRIVD